MLSIDDNDLYLYLRFKSGFDEINISKGVYEHLGTSTKLAYQFFKQQGLIGEGEFFKGLFKVPGKSLTLNSLITAEEFEGIVDVRYKNVLDDLFAPRKLNLRII